MRKFSATTTAALIALLVLALTVGCQPQQAPEEEEPESTRVEANISRGKFRGVGKVGHDCAVFEVKVTLVDSLTYQPGCTCPDTASYVYVELRRLTCRDTLAGTVWTGRTGLGPDDFWLHMPSGIYEPWSTGLMASVTVASSADPDDTYELHLDLNWEGLNDFRFRTERRYEGVPEEDPDGVPGLGETRYTDSVLRSWYRDEWSPAVVTGSIAADGIMFHLDLQENVRIISRTSETYEE